MPHLFRRPWLSVSKSPAQPKLKQQEFQKRILWYFTLPSCYFYLFEKEGVAWNCWLTVTIPIYLPLKDYKQYISTMTWVLIRQAQFCNTQKIKFLPFFLAEMKINTHKKFYLQYSSPIWIFIDNVNCNITISRVHTNSIIFIIFTLYLLVL